MKDSVKLVANNKKAWHDYFIDDKIECGIELFGTEVTVVPRGMQLHLFVLNIFKGNFRM